MQINIAICDDEDKILNIVSEKINNSFNKVCKDYNIYKTVNAPDILEHIKNNNIDVLFLDIDMPILNGMEIADALMQEGINIYLIFVTNYDSLVYHSLRYHPFGFIRKSHFDSEVDEIVKNVVEEIKKSADSFVFRCNNSICRIKIKDIMYFESESNYLNIHTIDKTYRYRGTISAVEDELSKAGFIRIHKGFLINQGYIRYLKNDSVELDNKEELPIGRTNKESARKLILRYLR